MARRVDDPALGPHKTMRRPRRPSAGLVAASGIATAFSRFSAHAFVLVPKAPTSYTYQRRLPLTLHRSSVSFSDLAQDYEARVEPVTTMFLEEMIEPFTTTDTGDSKRRLLDVGCGCGGGAIHAAKAGFAVTAIDNSPAFVGRLSERCDSRDKCLSISFQVADGQSLPAEFSSEFDFIMSSFALVFFPDPMAGLQEMHRCLVPGGRVVISGWGDRGNSPAFRIIPDAVRATAPELISASNKKKPFLRTPEEVATLMEGAGFVDIEIKASIQRTLIIPSAEIYFEKFALGSPPTRSMMVWMRDNMGEEALTKFKDVVMRLAIERGGGKPDGPIEIVSPAYFVYGTKNRESI